MNPELYEMLNKEEGQIFDRKSSKIDPKGVVNSLLGFAHADGGELVVGVSDDGKLEGFRGYPGKMEEIRSFIPTWLRPPVEYECKEIPFVHDDDGQKDAVLVLSVKTSSHVHENGKGEVYLRRGKETKLLDYSERELLIRDKGLQRFESSATNASIEDIDVEQLLAFGQKVKISSADPRTILLARDLAELKDNELRINYAGLLLFGKNPQKVIERARVRILRFEGTSEGTGTNLNLVKDQLIEGSILSQISEVEKILQSLFRDFTRLDPDTGRFVTVPEYPVFAWFEALVNAVTHREYSLFGVDIQIKIFDDRLEIVSPGNFPSTVKEYNIKDIHFSRNPKIARVMCDIGYVREMGEGVNRIFEEMKVAGLPEPVFKNIDSAVMVKLFNDAEKRTLRREHDLGQRIREDLFQQLSAKEKMVVLYCLENEKITTNECKALIGQSEDTALNLLKKLKAGTPPILLDSRLYLQDPKAFYYVNPQVLTSAQQPNPQVVKDEPEAKKKEAPISSPQDSLFDQGQG